MKNSISDDSENCISVQRDVFGFVFSYCLFVVHLFLLWLSFTCLLRLILVLLIFLGWCWLSCNELLCMYIYIYTYTYIYTYIYIYVCVYTRRCMALSENCHIPSYREHDDWPMDLGAPYFQTTPGMDFGFPSFCRQKKDISNLGWVVDFLSFFFFFTHGK